MKKILAEIPKGALSALGAALFAIISSSGLSAAREIWKAALSNNNTVKLIQHGLMYFEVAVLLSLGWLLFFPERRKRRSVERELASAKAHRFEDDYAVEPRLGVSRHKSKTGYFCTSCVSKGISSQLKEMEHGWECQIKGCEKFYENPNKPKPSWGVSIGSPNFEPRHFEPRHLGP